MSEQNESTARGRRLDWPMVTSVVTAFTALAALLFTGLSLQSNRAQVQVAQEGLITDRYTGAVDQIGTAGADRVQVRLGGIYALERLAQDSRRDRDTIVDVLAAFVRSSAPRTAEPCPQKAPVDVQAAFTVLARRSEPVRRYDTIDLRHTCLRGLEAGHTHLSGMSFVGADLSGAVFSGARFGLVSFVDATLTDATFEDATGDGFAFLDGADLTGANLRTADLRGMSFGAAVLDRADLTGTKLAGSDLSHVTRHDGAVVSGTQKDDRTRGAWW